MHAWRIARNPKTDLEEHSVAPGVGHALLSPLVAYTFEKLGVTASVWEHGADWKVIHSEAVISDLEYQYGKETERYSYNQRHFARVIEHKKTVQGQHAGLSDFFVPIVLQKEVAAILVAGPFLTSPPTSTEVLERWRWLSGRHAHAADPEFAAYFSATLSTLVLDTRQQRAFEGLLGCLAQLMAGEGEADQLANQAEALGAELWAARFTERAWAVAREMVDERSSKIWLAAGSVSQLERVGLSRSPDAVLVGLCKTGETNENPVDEALRRHAFQQSCVLLARKLGGLLAGQVGDHGVVFLSTSGGSLQARRQRLQDVAQRAVALARHKFGLSLYCGGTAGSRSALLNHTYETALAAAEATLAEGKRLVIVDAARRVGRSLRELRRELSRGVEAEPELLQPRFDRYLEAVAAHCGFRLELARGQIEAGFERIAEPLLAGGTLDDKSYAALTEVLERAADEATTLRELAAAYRRGVADIFEAVTKPTPARHDRTLRRALEYIHQHYGEALHIEQVARLSGFSADYFSRLFKQRERLTFERYVRRLRVERAKQLLSSTTLSISRIAELSGFKTAQYFCAVFNADEGTTAGAYRQQGSLHEARTTTAVKPKNNPGKSKIRRQRPR